MNAAWFNDDACTKLTISRLASIADDRVLSSVVIEDASAIALLKQRISTLPTRGGMMMKPGPDTPLTTLEFQGMLSSAAPDIIRVMGGRLVTPSTGILSPQPPGETAIVEDIEALLSPSLGKRMLKIEGLEVPFVGFSMAYLGRQQSESGPSTASHVTERYRVTIGDQTKELQIVSGQLPPAPESFRVGLSKRTLFTYETRDNTRLYPTYWVVQ